MKTEIRDLVEILNFYRDSYYNKGRQVVSDQEYDLLYDRLERLEKDTGIVFSNSPTQTVGYEVKTDLQKVQHDHPMLSLAKTKSVDDLKEFIGHEPCIMSLKMDGLTISLSYKNGELVKAETRGDGQVGNDVLHNVRQFKNVPLRISYKGDLTVDGEAIISYMDFERINRGLPEEEKYKNPRNLAAGTVNLLDSKLVKERRVQFVAWRVVGGTNMLDDFISLDEIGFCVVPHVQVNEWSNFEFLIENLRKIANEEGYPIDGLVVSYQDMVFGESLGATSHHPRHSIAFKFQEDIAETTIRSIEWSMGSTGALCPVAVFDPVDLCGTTVCRASLHNLSIMISLNIKIGACAHIVKKNEIIPQVVYCDGDGSDVEIPSTCPECGEKLGVSVSESTTTLMCLNQECKGKWLSHLEKFVSKQGMDIDGMSAATIRSLYERGFLNTFADIYRIHEHRSEIIQMDGFGEKSVDKLISAIEKSKRCKLENLLCAYDIMGIGRTQSKAISKYFGGDYWKFEESLLRGEDLTRIDGIGLVANNNLYSWYKDRFIRDGCCLLTIMLDVQTPEIKSGRALEGKTFCITGKLVEFSNRDELVCEIEKNGGNVSSSVSKNTEFLISNDKGSGSTKNQKALKLGIKIIDEKDFLNLIKNA